VTLGGNRLDRSELAGAFGDLGTLVPFVVGYITIARLDPQGVLLGFGLLALATGLYFRTPMPVQPMKAIATVAQFAGIFVGTAPGTESGGGGGRLSTSGRTPGDPDLLRALDHVDRWSTRSRARRR